MYIKKQRIPDYLEFWISKVWINKILVKLLPKLISLLLYCNLK